MLHQEDGWESSKRRELVVVACFLQLWLVLRTTSQLWHLKEGKRVEQKLSEFPVLARGTRSRTRRKITPEKHSFPAFRWYEFVVHLCDVLYLQRLGGVRGPGESLQAAIFCM